jgi:hypothetical protein
MSAEGQTTSYLRAFIGSLAPASAGPQPTNAGNPANNGSNQAPQTDDTQLVGNGTAGVHDAAGNDVAFPEPDVDYDFYAVFENRGKLPSGPCFVQFTLSGDKDWNDKCDLDDGLKAGASVEASVTFGRFPVPDDVADYRLNACIYSKAAPDKKINCVGEFGILISRP